MNVPPELLEVHTQVAVIANDVGHAVKRMDGMEARQKEMDEKLDILVDRVSDVRIENYKTGLLAAAVAAAVQALSAIGWKAHS